MAYFKTLRSGERRLIFTAKDRAKQNARLNESRAMGWLEYRSTPRLSERALARQLDWLANGDKRRIAEYVHLQYQQLEELRCKLILARLRDRNKLKPRDWSNGRVFRGLVVNVPHLTTAKLTEFYNEQLYLVKAYTAAAQRLGVELRVTYYARIVWPAS